MSVSSECKVGANEVIYFIDNCVKDVVFDDAGHFDVEKSTDFSIGEKVLFRNWYYKMVGDNQEIIIEFEDSDGRIFSACEAFLVTEDVWDGLNNYFKRYFYSNISIVDIS